MKRGFHEVVKGEWNEKNNTLFVNFDNGAYSLLVCSSKQ